VETKRFVGSFVNVILTWQTCGQRSSRAAESKRRALGNHFSERICYMFPISKCRGDRDLGLYTTSVPAFGEPQRNGKIRGKNVFQRRKNRVPKLCTDLDLGLLYILILGAYSKFARKNDFLALGVALRSPARALAAGLPRQDHVYKTTDESFRFHNRKFR